MTLPMKRDVRCFEGKGWNVQITKTIKLGGGFAF